MNDWLTWQNRRETDESEEESGVEGGHAGAVGVGLWRSPLNFVHWSMSIRVGRELWRVVRGANSHPTFQNFYFLIVGQQWTFSLNHIYIKIYSKTIERWLHPKRVLHKMQTIEYLREYPGSRMVTRQRGWSWRHAVRDKVPCLMKLSYGDSKFLFF